MTSSLRCVYFRRDVFWIHFNLRLPHATSLFIKSRSTGPNAILATFPMERVYTLILSKWVYTQQWVYTHSIGNVAYHLIDLIFAVFSCAVCLPFLNIMLLFWFLSKLYDFLASNLKLSCWTGLYLFIFPTRIGHTPVS